jgi:hypothetical protein
VTARLVFLATTAALLAAGPSFAQDPPDAGTQPDAGDIPDAGNPLDAGTAPDAGDVADTAQPASVSCTERLPDGATRPKLTEVLYGRGLSGHAATLVITIVHGKGEIVMPGGFRVDHGTESYQIPMEVQVPPPRSNKPRRPQRRKSPCRSYRCPKNRAGTTWCSRRYRSPLHAQAAKR